MSKAAVRSWWILAAAVFAAGFAAAGMWDLAIAEALYPRGRDSLFAALMEAFGWYPAFVPAILLAAVPAVRGGRRGGRLWQAALCHAVWIGGTAALYLVSWRYLVNRGILSPKGDARAWLWLAAGILLAGIGFFAVLRAGEALRAKLMFFGCAATVYMAANQTAVYALKLLWGRVRFDDMAAAGLADAFTPWWSLFGAGGSSFPSGHTANAAGILALLFLCDLCAAGARRRRCTAALCWAYVAAMAFARMMIGRHFLSDTLAAALIMAVLLYAMRRTPPYKNALARAQGRLRAVGGNNAV